MHNDVEIRNQGAADEEWVIDGELRELIERAAELIGVSEEEMIEECLTEFAEDLLSDGSGTVRHLTQIIAEVESS